jgi:hypothetical protein
VEGTVDEPRTVARAVQLLNNGELPGKYFDVKVKIDAPYISKVKRKIESGIMLQDGPGHPPKFDRFEIGFIRDILEQQQITAKSLLLSTVQLLIRVTLLIKRGAVAVEALDERIELKSGVSKRKRSRKKQAESDSDTDENENDDAENEAERMAREESFRSIKNMLGDACSMSLAETGISRYPTRRQVRSLCSKEGWYVRKGQQTSCWRYEGCTPPMISLYFSNVIRIFVLFDIRTPGQKGNCDEKRLNAEFEKLARRASSPRRRSTALGAPRTRAADYQIANSLRESSEYSNSSATRAFLGLPAFPSGSNLQRNGKEAEAHALYSASKQPRFRQMSRK